MSPDKNAWPIKIQGNKKGQKKIFCPFRISLIRKN